MLAWLVPLRRSRLWLAAAAAVVSALAISWWLWAVRSGNERSAAAATHARERFEELCRGAGDERRNVAVR